LRSELEALVAHPDDQAAEQLAARVRAWFGADELTSGAPPKVDELTVAWALEAAGAAPKVVSDDGAFTLPLARIGRTDVFAAVTTLPWGTVLRWRYEVGDAEGRTLGPV
jgi:hypothetical protein